MKKSLLKFLTLLMCAVTLCSVSGLFVSANSAIRYFSGTDGCGVVFTDKDIPVTVKGELLTFDIPSFPVLFGSSEDLADYDASVTAKYTFHNPADYTVTAELLFPFGNRPDYAETYDADGNTEYFTDTEKYNILVGGEPVDKMVRYSYAEHWNDFDLDRDMAKVSHTFIESEYFYPEMPVTKYTFTVETSSGTGSEYLAFELPKKDGAFWLLDDFSGMDVHKDGSVRLGKWCGNGASVTLFAFGGAERLPDVDLYEDGSENCGKLPFEKKDYAEETMTFRDYALGLWEEEIPMSEVDRYNASVAALEDGINYKDRNYIELYGKSGTFDERYLMRWYEYEITLAPGETLENVVTAPIYPEVDEYYSPAKYTYTYLLSPAKTWAGFGSLEIVINSDYYLIDSNRFDFEKTEDGYRLLLDGLPKSELEFTLCSSEHPKRDKQSVWIMIFILILPIVLILVSISVLIIIAYLIRYFKKRNDTSGNP